MANIIGDGKGISEAQRKALDAYAQGGKMQPGMVDQIRNSLAASPTSADAIQSGDRVLGARQSPDATGTMQDRMTRNRQGSVVSANNVERTLSDGRKVQVPAKFRDLPVEKLEARLNLAPGAKGKITAFTPQQGLGLEMERRTTAGESTQQLQQKRQAIKDQRAARQTAAPSGVERKSGEYSNIQERGGRRVKGQSV